MSGLKEARKKAGCTQQQASDESGVALGTLRRWEQGVNEPDIDSIIKLADLYGVSTDELLGSRFAVEYTTEELTDGERLLVDLYRMCGTQGRECLLAIAKVISEMFAG